MQFNARNGHRRTQGDRRPYAMLGSGRLLMALFKDGSEHCGWRYRFNLFHLNDDDGLVSHWFTPCDITAIPKLIRLLAFELCEDGCIPDELRSELKSLISRLDLVLDESASTETIADFTHRERLSLVEVVDYLMHFSGHVVTGNGDIVWHVEQLRDWLDRSAPAVSPEE